MKMRRLGWIAQSLNFRVKRKSSFIFILKRGSIRRFLRKPKTFNLIVTLINFNSNLLMKSALSFALSFNFLFMNIKSGCIPPMAPM